MSKHRQPTPRSVRFLPIASTSSTLGCIKHHMFRFDFKPYFDTPKHGLPRCSDSKNINLHTQPAFPPFPQTPTISAISAALGFPDSRIPAGFPPPLCAPCGSPRSSCRRASGLQRSGPKWAKADHICGVKWVPSRRCYFQTRQSKEWESRRFQGMVCKEPKNNWLLIVFGAGTCFKANQLAPLKSLRLLWKKSTQPRTSGVVFGVGTLYRLKKKGGPQNRWCSSGSNNSTPQKKTAQKNAGKPGTPLARTPAPDSRSPALRYSLLYHRFSPRGSRSSPADPPADPKACWDPADRFWLDLVEANRIFGFLLPAIPAGLSLKGSLTANGICSALDMFPSKIGSCKKRRSLNQKAERVVTWVQVPLQSARSLSPRETHAREQIGFGLHFTSQWMLRVHQTSTGPRCGAMPELRRGLVLEGAARFGLVQKTRAGCQCLKANER